MKKIVLLLFASVITLGAFLIVWQYIAPPPEIYWKRNSTAVVISFDSTGYEVAYNHIPMARLWGDGRLIWVEYDVQGRRNVFQASLVEDQIAGIIQEFIDAGFFRPNLRGLLPSSGADTFDTLTINLIDRSKYEGYHNIFIDKKMVSDELREAVENLVHGEGEVGESYVPNTGYLHAWLAEDSGCRIIPPDVPEWSFDDVDFDQVSADEWIMVSGSTLEFVWNVVNKDEVCSLVRYQGIYYDLALLIPGITEVQPYDL